MFFQMLLYKKEFYAINNLCNNWKIKDNIVWIKDCPVPTNEVLMRL